jgi:hypothetical protein
VNDPRDVIAEFLRRFTDEDYRQADVLLGYLDSAGLTVVRPSSDWDYENGGTLVIDEPAPSPYRFTVSVEQWDTEDGVVWEVYLRGHGIYAYTYLGSRTTEAEARSHAALVLAALHQAEMEDQ